MQKSSEKETAEGVKSTHRLSDSKIKWEKRPGEDFDEKCNYYWNVGNIGYLIIKRQRQFYSIFKNDDMKYDDYNILAWSKYLKEAKIFCEKFHVIFSKCIENTDR